MKVDPTSAVLQVLLHDASYSLAIIDEVARRTEGDIKLSQSRTYATLLRLEDEGLIKTCEIETPSEVLAMRGGRPRHYYQLTPKGCRRAMKEREAAAKLYALMSA